MIGQTELIIVLFIVLLLFGGKKLPELARSMGTAVREYSSATKEPGKYIEEKTKTKEEEEREAILEAAKKMGIETEGRSLSEIAQDLVKATEKKE
ncbi:MAG: twin-arginine translocase TatA/TatE family subunit [Candidatus Bathyarchaeota archaeon]|jgi:sec-independent protein translocase protein TatA|nr:twin-arginine translocase TatA/TatE family subunit [Candidatus Bathyarchaeota archaeon]